MRKETGYMKTYEKPELEIVLFASECVTDGPSTTPDDGENLG